MKLVFNLILIIVLFSFKSIDREKSGIYIPNNDIHTLNTGQNDSFIRGRQVYSDFCVTCHLPDGKGVQGINPPLDGSNWLTEKRKESIHAVKFGLQGLIEVNGEKYNGMMTPLGLSDQEVADVMNYIMNSWSNSCENPVTLEEVAAVKKFPLTK